MIPSSSSPAAFPDHHPGAKFFSGCLVPSVLNQMELTPTWIFGLILCIYCLLAPKYAPRAMCLLFRSLYDYASRAPHQLSSESSSQLDPQSDPYENNIFSALEAPTTYFFIFVGYYLGIIWIAPTVMPIVITEYISQSWKGAIVLCIVWFLYQWKTIFFLKKDLMEVHEDKWMIFDKLLSFSLIALGVIGLVGVYDLPIQSIIKFGGMAGAVITFVGKDFFKNILCGFYLQLTKPFTIGDVIQIEETEGTVIKMEMINISLSSVNSNGSIVIIPNSLFFRCIPLPRTPRAHNE